MFDRANERALMSAVSAVVGRDVRVGIDDAPTVPMPLGNPETGDFRGYEVNLLGEIGRRAGFRLSYRRALWSAIVSERMTGEADLICQLLCAQVVTLASRVFMKSKIA
jgi:ABC-type amino acid transport substrate-binding protein